LKALADLLALLSVVFLAIPAYHINHYAWLAARVTLTHVHIVDPELEARHQALRKKLEALRDAWTPWKAWCLHIGTATGLLAAALTFAASVHESLSPAAK